MLNSITISCAKYVKKHCINNCIISGLLSTNDNQVIQSITNYVCKYPVLNIYPTLTSTDISTYKKSLFNLLNKSFTHFPQYLLLEPLKENLKKGNN